MRVKSCEKEIKISCLLFNIQIVLSPRADNFIVSISTSNIIVTDRDKERKIENKRDTRGKKLFRVFSEIVPSKNRLATTRKYT